MRPTYVIFPNSYIELYICVPPHSPCVGWNSKQYLRKLSSKYKISLKYSANMSISMFSQFEVILRFCAGHALLRCTKRCISKNRELLGSENDFSIAKFCFRKSVSRPCIFNELGSFNVHSVLYCEF